MKVYVNITYRVAWNGREGFPPTSKRVNQQAGRRSTQWKLHLKLAISEYNSCWILYTNNIGWFEYATSTWSSRNTSFSYIHINYKMFVRGRLPYFTALAMSSGLFLNRKATTLASEGGFNDEYVWRKRISVCLRQYCRLYFLFITKGDN